MKTIIVVVCGLPLALFGQESTYKVPEMKPLPIEQIRANLADQEAKDRLKKEQEVRHQFYVKMLKDSQTAPNPTPKQVQPPTPAKPVPAPRYVFKPIVAPAIVPLPKSGKNLLDEIKLAEQQKKERAEAHFQRDIQEAFRLLPDKNRRLSTIEWHMLYGDYIRPNREAYFRGEITYHEHFRWEAAVKQAMLDKYGQPLKDPEPRYSSTRYSYMSPIEIQLEGISDQLHDIQLNRE